MNGKKNSVNKNLDSSYDIFVKKKINFYSLDQSEQLLIYSDRLIDNRRYGYEFI